MKDDGALVEAIETCFTFPPRRPGWFGGIVWALVVARAILIYPVLLVFAFLQFVAQGIQAVAGVALGLGAVALALYLGYIFLMAFLKFAAWAVR